MFPGAPKYPAAEEQLSQEDPSMKITGMRSSGNLNHMFPPTSGEGWKVSLGIDESSRTMPKDIFNKDGAKNKVDMMLGLSGGKKSKLKVTDYFGKKNNKVIDMLDGGNSNKKVDDMLNFNSGKKNIKVNMMLGRSKDNKKVDMMLGTKTKGKSFKMDDWFAIGKTKNTVSDVLGNFAIKPMKPFFVEKRARKQMLKNPANIGFTRLRQQRGLSPMGDFDGDGLINALDCNPLDKNKQGWMHSAWAAVKGTPYSSEEDVELPASGEVTLKKPKLPIEMEITRGQTDEPTPNLIVTTPDSESSFEWGGYVKPTAENDPMIETMPENPVGYNYYEMATPGRPLPKEIEETGSKIWLPTKEVALKAIETYGKYRTHKAKFESEVEKATIKDRAKEEARLRKGQYGYMPKTLRGTARVFANAPSAFAGGTSGIGGLTGPQQGAERMAYMLGLTGSGGGAYQAVASSGTPYSVKVDELVGGGELAQQYREQQVAIPQVPTPAPMPVQQSAPQPIQQSRAIDGNRVWSPYSRRYVTYTRGPYRR